MSLRQMIGKIVPDGVRQAYGRYRWEQELKRRRERHAKMSAEEVFTEIYAQNQWGGEPGEFYSGWGSVDEACTRPYVTTLLDWLRSETGETITVVDLGCGDFRVGRFFVDACRQYIGVDIVKDLVAHNQEKYGSDKVKFVHLNIIEEELPDGDVCFVRQVLQHLSNEEIVKVLGKLRKYRWAIITEHYPAAEITAPNLDKPHGFDVRLTQNSAVVLDKPPFNIESGRIRTLLEVREPLFPGSEDDAVIKTFLVDFR